MVIKKNKSEPESCQLNRAHLRRTLNVFLFYSVCPLDVTKSKGVSTSYFTMLSFYFCREGSVSPYFGRSESKTSYVCNKYGLDDSGAAAFMYIFLKKSFSFPRSCLCLCAKNFCHAFLLNGKKLIIFRVNQYKNDLIFDCTFL